jgi:hypothetical protein
MHTACSLAETLYESIIEMKIIVTDTGQLEVKRLNIDIQSMIQGVLNFVPNFDRIGIFHIYVTSKPEDYKDHQRGAHGAYYPKHKSRPPYIALYLQNLFGYLKDGKQSKHMLPILEIGLAHTLFHEFGHHIEHTRSHGIKKKKKENYADSYAKRLISKYVVDRANCVNKCFDHLEKIAERKGLSMDTIRKMKDGWNLEFEDALKTERQY